MTRPVPVLSAGQAAATDAAAIAAGTASLDLMERAGAGAAAVIQRRYAQEAGGGVRVLTGPGNNGGDGWVVARHLAGMGFPVAVEAVSEPRTDDARAMRDRAAGCHSPDVADGASLLVDALLGTGATGAPRGAIGEAVGALRAARASGARIVALDVPTGMDATTGEATLVAPADCTITFGSIKRGHLLARHLVGALVVIDIGLGETQGDGAIVELATPEWVRGTIPAIAADAHKGTRRKLLIVGGARGMAGATILAARSALRSGVGMVRLVVDHASLPVVQGAVPAALAAAWPGGDDEAAELVAWGDGLLIGPGLGDAPSTRALVERIVTASDRPVTLDADALNAFRGEAEALGRLLRGRIALITPHPAEAARLFGTTVEDILARRYDVAGELAARTRAAVLLKGVPTVIAGVDGRTMASARGTPVLATAGSGDVLAGIAATLLAQIGDPFAAGACAAFVHGRAAELADPSGAVRGVALDDVIDALRRAWREWPAPPAPPAIAELPSVGGVS